MRLNPDSIKKIDDYSIKQEISKNLNDIMINIIEFSNSNTCFETLLTLSIKYDHLYESNQICQILAKCLIKLTKKVVKRNDDIDIERIFLSLHKYLIKYSSNVTMINQGKLVLKKSLFRTNKRQK